MTTTDAPGGPDPVISNRTEALTAAQMTETKPINHTLKQKQPQWNFTSSIGVRPTFDPTPTSKSTPSPKIPQILSKINLNSTKIKRRSRRTRSQDPQEEFDRLGQSSSSSNGGHITRNHFRPQHGPNATLSPRNHHQEQMNKLSMYMRRPAVT